MVLNFQINTSLFPLEINHDSDQNVTVQANDQTTYVFHQLSILTDDAHADAPAHHHFCTRSHCPVVLNFQINTSLLPLDVNAGSDQNVCVPPNDQATYIFHQLSDAIPYNILYPVHDCILACSHHQPFCNAGGQIS